MLYKGITNSPKLSQEKKCECDDDMDEAILSNLLENISLLEDAIMKSDEIKLRNAFHYFFDESNTFILEIFENFVTSNFFEKLIMVFNYDQFICEGLKLISCFSVQFISKISSQTVERILIPRVLSFLLNDIDEQCIKYCLFIIKTITLAEIYRSSRSINALLLCSISQCLKNDEAISIWAQCLYLVSKNEINIEESQTIVHTLISIHNLLVDLKEKLIMCYISWILIYLVDKNVFPFEQFANSQLPSLICQWKSRDNPDSIMLIGKLIDKDEWPLYFRDDFFVKQMIETTSPEVFDALALIECNLISESTAHTKKLLKGDSIAKLVDKFNGSTQVFKSCISEVFSYIIGSEKDCSYKMYELGVMKVFIESLESDWSDISIHALDSIIQIHSVILGSRLIDEFLNLINEEKITEKLEKLVSSDNPDLSELAQFYISEYLSFMG